MKRKVGIIGCSHILARHLESIRENLDSFELVALCDTNEEVLEKVVSENGNVESFNDYKKMLGEMKGKMNFVVIATPNHLHYAMAVDSLKAGYDVLIEKPIAFESSKAQEIQDLADELSREVYCVLQVRYNSTVEVISKVLKKGLLGDVRCVNFVQRWQRPIGYFENWRGVPEQGGRPLYEFSIHYLDIIQQNFGLPKVKAIETFNHKHLAIPFEDTLYSIVEYGGGISGVIEFNVVSEPSNLECSISIQGSQGFLKIGGKALDEVEVGTFEDEDLQKEFEKIVKNTGNSLPNSLHCSNVGSCPKHPVLYKEIARGRGFKASEAIQSIKFIEKLYSKNDEIR